MRAPGDGSETRIERSGRVELGPGVRPADDGGALWIAGDGITVELAGELRGAPRDAAADTFTGVGLRVTGKGVTLRGARVSGYRVGIWAAGADGLVLEDCDVSGNFRQHLHSTKEKEAVEDWLEPHANDAHEWFTRYGAGIHVERARDVTVRRCRARAGQNGLVLERVDHAQVYDNDFSFLSGWGIALWRSCDNVIARNACDFCIRGYSHGVYNRGQDSAGLLLFEQCSRNEISENSATHCGDGFFSFAGQEALGSVPPPSPDFDYRGRGCNDNRIYSNDFSYAAAHGLELTFSFDNYIYANEFVDNAICGIWAGYSRRTYITCNRFERNGSGAYGLERGGINIEHGQDNRIQQNKFSANACGVHLWWDDDKQLAETPWVRANGYESKNESVFHNSFDGDELALQARGPMSFNTAGNRFSSVIKDLDVSGDAVGTERTDWNMSAEGNPLGYGRVRELPGNASPVGARRSMRGRDQIQLDDWGPIEPSIAK